MGASAASGTGQRAVRALRSDQEDTGLPSAWVRSREKAFAKEAEEWAAPTDLLRLPFRQLPLVDLSSHLHGKHGTASVVEELRQACEEVGFFHIIGWEPLLSPELIERTMQAAEVYFAQPEAAKLAQDLSVARRENTGYLPVGSKLQPKRKLGNLNEAFIISNHADAVYQAQRQEDEPPAPMPWPPELGPCWQQTVEEFMAAMSSLACALMGLVALALDLPESYFQPLLAPPGPLTRLRMTRYPAVEEAPPEPGQYGLAPHVDMSLLTLVTEAGEPGLALHSPKLGGWVRAHMPRTTLLVNSGEILRAITNDRWPSARHYVINPSQSTQRMSLAFFLSPSPAVPMSVAPSCVTEAEPAKYRPTTWIEGKGVHRGGFLAPAIAEGRTGERLPAAHRTLQFCKTLGNSHWKYHSG